MARIIVDPRGVGPISLDRDDRKPLMLDQAARDRRPRTVEFRRAVGRFAKQHDARVGEAIEAGAELFSAIRIGQRLGMMAQRRYQLVQLARGSFGQGNVLAHDVHPSR